MRGVLAQRSQTILMGGASTAILLLLAAWPFTGFGDTYGRWLGWPHPGMVALLVFFLAAAGAGGPWRRTWCLLAGASLFGIHAGFRVLTMGDGHWWRWATAKGIVSYAEPLSSGLYRLVFVLGGPGAIEWISPAAGLAATYAWLRATDRLIAAGDPAAQARARRLAALLWASSGVTLLFCLRFVEHTQLGIAPLVLGLANLTSWARSVVRGAAGEPRGLLSGATWLTIAALTHLVYAGMLVAALGAAALLILGRAPAGIGRTLRQIAVHAIALVAATLGLLHLLGREVITGSITGGIDDRWMVRIVDDSGSWFAAGTLLSAHHLAITALAITFACPVAIPLAAAAWRRWRGLATLAPSHLVLAAAAAAHLTFLCLYGFDLGWPTDLDLMISMSPSLSLLAASLLLSPDRARTRAGDRRLAAVLILCVLSTWCLGARLVRPAWVDLRQANSPAASLVVAGASGGAATQRVHAAIGDRIEMQLAGPPGAGFFVCHGAPAPAGDGNPYDDSVIDIDLVGGFTPASVVHSGTFDAQGRASATWIVQALPDGALPGLQMVVFHDGRSATSAAVYLDPR